MNLAYSISPRTPYQELLDLPDNLVGEILNGELHTQPRPSGPHGNAETGMSAALRPPFHLGKGGPGGWWILAEPEVHFVRDIQVAVPDLAGWRRERMPKLPEGHRFETVPDWVCEILSPGTVRKDRGLKLPLYAQYGVGHAWLVDPLARTLEAFELRAGNWFLLGVLRDEDPVSMPPFAAVIFSLDELWA